MSVVGLLMLWLETGKTGDHVFGFVLHVCVPSVMVLFLAWRGQGWLGGLIASARTVEGVSERGALA